MNYEKCSDETLIDMYRVGNETAIETLFDRYKNLVRKKAKSMYIAGGDNDDLIQEGMIGLFKAIRDFDEEKEASFRTFANVCIVNNMVSAVKASNCKKHQPLNQGISLNADSPDGEDGGLSLIEELTDTKSRNPEDMLIDRENVEILQSEIDSALSEYEKRVLTLYLGGMDYTEIAATLMKSDKSIDNALQRIKGKIKRIIN